MTVSFTYDMPKAERISRNLAIITGSITFDASYPAGGEVVGVSATNSPADKFYNLLNMTFDGPHNLLFDATNDKVKVFGNAPPIVFEEKHTAVANAVTLDYPAAWIINVCTAGQNEALTARADSLSDNECKLTSAIADGVRTGITTYGSTDVIYVTYATQAWAELYALLVDEETMGAVLAAGNNDLTYAPMAIGYVYASSTGLLLPVDVAEAGSTAAGEVGVNMVVSAGAGTSALITETTQDGETGTVTYLKKPAATSWIGSRLVADENPSAATGINTFDFPLLMWCLTGVATVSGGTTEKIILSSDDAAANEAVIIWGAAPVIATVGAAAAGFAIAEGDASHTITAGCYLKGSPWEIPNLVPLEVKNGTDLSYLTVRFTAIGTL